MNTNIDIPVPTTVLCPTTDVHSKPFELFSSLQYAPLLLSSTENTSICGSPCPFYLLPYHRDRMLSAARHFKWSATALGKLQDLEGFQKCCEDGANEFVIRQENKGLDQDLNVANKALKLRVLLTSTGQLSIDASIIPSIPINHLLPSSPSSSSHTTLTDLLTTFSTVYTIHLDISPTTPSSFTRFKTTSRSHYDLSRTRCGILSYAQKEEVVLYNRDGYVMEGSLTNVYICRNGVWITPSAEQGGEGGAKEEEGGGGGGGAGGTGGTVRRWLLEKRMIKVEDFKMSDLADEEWMYLSNGVRGLILGRVSLQRKNKH